MKNLYLLIVLTAWAACTGGGQKKENDTAEKETIRRFEGLPAFDLQKEYPKKEIILQDIADVSYIALETNDKSLVSNYRIIMTDSLIITKNKNSDLLFFDRSGKFLHSFNRTGMSGEEYGDDISGYCIDTKAQEIFIYDGIRKNIKVYDYKGEFKRTLKMPRNLWFFNGILDYDENYLFGEDRRFVDALDIHENRINKTPYYKISKKDGELVSIPITVKERIRDGLFYSKGEIGIGTSLRVDPVARWSSDILIADYSLDTVYTYRDDKLTPLAVRHNNKTENNIPIIATIDLMTDRYLLWYTVVKDIDIEKNYVPDPISYLYDRFTNEYCQAEIINRDGAPVTDPTSFLTRLSANYHTVPKNYALQCYPAHLLIELNEQGKLKGELKEIASKLDEEDNPVLIIAKFKE